jgi:hypothetical protein
MSRRSPSRTYHKTEIVSLPIDRETDASSIAPPRLIGPGRRAKLTNLARAAVAHGQQMVALSGYSWLEATVDKDERTRGMSHRMTTTPTRSAASAIPRTSIDER